MRVICTAGGQPGKEWVLETPSPLYEEACQFGPVYYRITALLKLIEVYELSMLRADVDTMKRKAVVSRWQTIANEIRSAKEMGLELSLKPQDSLRLPG